MRTHRIVILTLIVVFGCLYWFSIQKNKDLKSSYLFKTSLKKQPDTPLWWNAPNTDDYIFGYGMGEGTTLNIAERMAHDQALSNLSKEVADTVSVGVEIADRHSIMIDNKRYRVYMRVKLEIRN